jgi:hypothetical protein
VYAAIQEALAGFKTLPAGSPKSFIYTGNMLNLGPSMAFINLLPLGVGKTASAHMIQLAAMAFHDREYK